MAAQRPRLSGSDWQNWANQLLVRHYGPMEYQQVPDKHKGDAGLEGFTITKGHAFQAYGPEEPLSTQDRYVKQRDKMTADVAKFIKNAQVLSAIFGRVRITRWTLFVPVCDSIELIAHASKKTEEIIMAQLPYAADELRVMVCDEEIFAAEANALLSTRVDSLELVHEGVSDEQVVAWADEHDTIVERLDGKLRKLPSLATDAQRHAFRDKVLKWYLEGQDMLAGLRKYPAAYEKIIKAKSHRENFLAASTISDTAKPGDVFQTALRSFLETVKREAMEVSALSCDALAHEAVADWMLRCPLDFPEVSVNV
jgi:hypothetical protein